MKKSIFGVALLLVMAFVGMTAVAGQKDGKKEAGLPKANTNDMTTFYTINNLFNIYQNNGNGSYNIYTGNAGLEYPKGSGNTAVFEDGLVWGCYKGSNLMVGGSTYRQGLQAGPILTAGVPGAGAVAADPGDAQYRIYRTRPDIYPTTDATLKAAMLAILAKEEVPYIERYAAATAQSLYDEYVADWNNWPASQGAPYTDVDHNGSYDPTVDKPGVSGANQTLWYIANDLDGQRTRYTYGSDPIGIEFQRTIWGYKRTGALGNTIFVRNKVINKSTAQLDTMYFSWWSDPDLGDAGDDFAGCDTVRSLGYVYNGRARDSYYGDKPPAVGYTFFQGPVVASPGDSAVFNNGMRYNYKNLKMSAFVFFINGNSTYVDPNLGTYTGTQQWWNLMNGRISGTGGPFIDPTTGEATKFTLAGDPTTGTGWIDGTVAPPGDRRFCMVTGPFTMAAGDTQEVVVSEMVGQGGDRLSSISVLKFYSDQAQAAYNSFFNLAAPPPAPVVSVAQLDGQIVLDWSKASDVAATESFVDKGYTFEGYNVYQASDGAGTNAKLLATYDKIDGVGKIWDYEYDATAGVILYKPVQYGNDNDVFRSYATTDDALTGKKLANFNNYYYAVTAYSYNAGGVPKALESALNWIDAVPQPANPGTVYAGEYGQVVDGVKLAGGSDGIITATIINPTKLTGHVYHVTFDTTGGTMKWNLVDSTLGTTVLANQTNISGDNDYQVVDGMLVRVSGPAVPGMKDWSIPNGARRWTWADADGLGLEGFYGAIGYTEPSVVFGVNATPMVTPAELRNVLIKLAPASSDTANNGKNYYAGWDPNTVTDANFSYGYRYVRGGQGAPARPEFAPYVGTANYPTLTATWGFADYSKNTVPFSAWNVETNPATQLAVGFSENNVTGGLVDGRYWPPSNGFGETNTEVGGPREWFFIFNKPYTGATPDATLEQNILYNAMPVMWLGTVNRRANANYKAGDEFLISAYHVLTAADVFSFTSPKNTVNSLAEAKADVEKINVFPNPYFGVNLAEPSKYVRFVTFTHLPKKATVRIFTLAGVLVRTLVKDDDTQVLRWDLLNGAGLPVSAGMFVAYVDMPELGKSKILKLAVIPEAEILDKL